MTKFISPLRIKAATLCMAGLLAGQNALAGDFGRALLNTAGNQGAQHSNSSGNNQPKGSDKQPGMKVITATNGNTGINGTGLPQSGVNANSSGNNQSKGSDKKVISAPNGNTGINGTGLPQSGGNSTKGSANKPATLTQGLNQGKNGAKGPSKADLDAQAAAEKAYVAAQNDASAHRGQLGSAQAKYDQAHARALAASAVYSKNPTEANKLAVQNASNDQTSAALDLAEVNGWARSADQRVATATAAKNAADAKVQAATASNAGSGGSGKSSGGGTLPSNNFPFPAGRVITSGSSPVRNAGSMTTTYPTTVAPNVQPAATMAASTTDTATAVATGADLVLEDIQLASPATLVAGPAYTVKFRNQGTGSASHFQVGVLAGVDGKIAADAPRGVVEVKSLAAGQSAEVTLRLPQSALKMTGADGRSTAFTHLAVAVDLMNTVAETDETNNTASVERAGLEATAAN